MPVVGSSAAMRLGDFALVCVFALLVASCARPDPFAKTRPEQVSSDPGLATVVIGQTFLGNQLLDDRCPTSLGTHWSSGGTPVFGFEVRAIECVGKDQAPTLDFSVLPARYTVLQLRPGNYRLDRVSNFRPMEGTTVTPIRDTQPTPRGWPDMTVPRFAVAAGEVVHVGTLVFFRVEPVRLRTTANLAGARAALQEIWPEAAERMVERRMLVGAAPNQ
jgi:hypothetical protein